VTHAASPRCRGMGNRLGLPMPAPEVPDMVDRPVTPAERLHGVPLLPVQWCYALGMWSKREQRRCLHPPHRRRIIGGDERNYGYRQQCMDCGLLYKQAPS